jgi:hypothetical protein
VFGAVLGRKNWIQRPKFGSRSSTQSEGLSQRDPTYCGRFRPCRIDWTVDRQPRPRRRRLRSPLPQLTPSRLHDDKGSLLSRVPSFSPPESCTASRPNSMQVCFGPTSRIRSAHIAYPVDHHSIPTFHLSSTAYSIRIEE